MLVAPRLAGHHGPLVSSQSDLSRIPPCGFPVCRLVGSVSKPVSRTPSLNLPSVASGRGVSLGLLSWAHQTIMSLLSGSMSVASPVGTGACKRSCMVPAAPAHTPCSLPRSPASPTTSPAPLSSNWGKRVPRAPGGGGSVGAG